MIGSQQCSVSGNVLLDERLLLRDLDLDFRPGWTCLLGPSGSGKSTLLRLIGGLNTKARLRGKLVVPSKIGWMAQSDLLQPRFNLLANVGLMARLRGETLSIEKAEKYLAAVGLFGLGKRKPATLSGGQRQRVALARTLYEQAPVVLLDEPFSALDPVTRVKMQDLTYASLTGCTVIMVTHDPAEALRMGERILMITDGRLREFSGTPGQRPLPVNDPMLAKSSADLLAELVAAE